MTAFTRPPVRPLVSAFRISGNVEEAFVAAAQRIRIAASLQPLHDVGAIIRAHSLKYAADFLAARCTLQAPRLRQRQTPRGGAQFSP